MTAYNPLDPSQPAPQPDIPSDVPSIAPPHHCGECGLLFASADIMDYCERCGAARCRNCAALAGDDRDGAYICSTCGAELDAV